jgi:hypothetical protein
MTEAVYDEMFNLQTVAEEFGVPLTEIEDVVRVASRRAA